MIIHPCKCTNDAKSWIPESWTLKKWKETQSMYEIHVTLEDWTGLIVTSPETLTMLTIDGVTSNDEQDTLVATITWNLTPADLQLYISIMDLISWYQDHY